MVQQIQAMVVAVELPTMQAVMQPLEAMADPVLLY